MPVVPKDKLPGRNELCPCGSGLKVKLCHGDPIKRALCSQVVNQFMANLIQEEQKKCGLISYNFICQSCKAGFDTPTQTTTLPKRVICPKCGSTDIEKVKNESMGNKKR